MLLEAARTIVGIVVLLVAYTLYLEIKKEPDTCLAQSVGLLVTLSAAWALIYLLRYYVL